MKTNIKHFLYMAALLLLTGCSQDDESMVETPDNAKPLTFTITDAGYSAGGNGSTRAAEDGYTTQFTAGDACGLYIVRNGEVKTANVKLIAKDVDGKMTWAPEDANVTLKGETTDKYYLYYPYQSDKDNKVTESATDDSGFFASLISGWEVKSDQSDYKKGYTASDLMTAKNEEPTETDGTISLTFKMLHRMSLAVIEMPKTVYHFNNTPEISDYIIGKAVNAGFEQSAAKPYEMVKDGIYRYIVNPQKTDGLEIKGSYSKDGKQKQFTISSTNFQGMNAGKGKRFKIDGGIKEFNNYTLQVGDFLLKDGNLISVDQKDALSDEQKANVAAIVFWAGDATAKDKTLKADHSGCTHGLAVAVNGDEETQWQSAEVSVQDWLNANKSGAYLNVQTEGIGLQHQVNNIQGYNNTKAIEDYNNANTDSKVLAVEKIVAYRASNPAPASSSNWYLPSAKELSIICGKDVTKTIWGAGNNVGTENRDVINASLQNVDGATQLGTTTFYCYLSSTEHSGTGVVYVKFSNGFVTYDGKSYSNHVRPVLAF